MSKKRTVLFTVLILVAFALLLALEVFKKYIFGGAKLGETLYMISTRYLGGVIAIVLVSKYLGKDVIIPVFSKRGLLIIIPCFLVAINNFPFISYISGDAYIDSSIDRAIILVFLCLGVGFFEEILFRGCIFVAILKRFGNTKASLFISLTISSAIFGATHLLNLIGGGGGEVILQVGYSFLTGAMFSFVLIMSGNIWYSVLLHAIYNFCGSAVPTLGGGIIWNTPTVILTAVLAVAVTVYCAWVFVKTDLEDMFTFNR